MEIEAGEYFAVTRGAEDGTIDVSLPYLMAGREPPPQDTKKKEYDRSFDGCIFLALDVCYPVIAAKCIFTGPDKTWKLGTARSFNLLEIEIMTVTKGYVDALGVTVDFKGNEVRLDAIKETEADEVDYSEL